MSVRLADGQILTTHDEDQCAGRKCCIHDPSDHPLKRAPFIWRPDRNGLMERLCVHGIGHPDPDSLKYLQSQGIDDSGIHGCCGICCVSSEGDVSV